MHSFSIFANGTFWGVFRASDAATAIQAAADEHGTDGNTDGMTAKLVGNHVLEVIDGCRSNGVEFRDLVCEFFNCREADVDDQGEIWIANPQNGHWLDADALE